MLLTHEGEEEEKETVPEIVQTPVVHRGADQNEASEGKE